MTPMQKEILRAIELHGGITPLMTDKHGWTRESLPTKEMQELIVRKIIAPRVLTSQPLRVVWQMRDLGAHKATLSKIESEARRLGMQEYAEGGFELTLRKELKGVIR